MTKRNIKRKAVTGVLNLLLASNVWAGKPAAPGAPSSLTASAISSSQITLNWQESSSSVSGFNIQRAPTSGGTWAQIATVSGTVRSYTDTGLSASKTYYYRANAYNSKGNSSYSSVASATTQAAAACTYSCSPLNVSYASGTASGAVNVTAGTGCAWSATANNSWIAITSGSSGSGSGSVGYSVAANASTSARTGTMTIAGGSVTVSQNGNVPPVAVAGANVSVSLGSAVTLNGSGSYDPDGTIASYFWNFGDGNSAAGATVSHTYAVVGAYTATLSVTDNLGATASSSTLVTVLAAADTTPPTVILTYSGGTYVSGILSLSASASDNVGVTKVEFYRDGTLFTTMTLPPYSTSFDTRTLANGAHTFLAKAYDAAGNSSSSSQTPIVDNTAPTASLTAPASGSTVSSTITLSATASDNSGGSGVAKVEFYCDNATTPLATATAAPYSASCDTTAMANGSHNFYCKAYDAAGNSANSSSVTVTANNVTTSPGQLAWVKTMLSQGGNAPVNAVVSDHSGNVYAIGYFNGTVNFGSGAISSLPVSTTANAFIAKYSPQGTLSWVKILAGTGNVVGRGVSVDSQGNIIVVGGFGGALDFGGGTLTSLANENMFVAKYSASGAYQWAKRLGGTYSDAGCCVAVDSSDNAVLTGRFTSINADYGNGWTLSCSGSQSIALVKLSGSTGSTLWAKAYGGSGYNQPQGLAVDRNGDAVITGYFMTATDLGGGSLASAGANDIFLAKYSGVDGSYKWGKRLGSTSGDSGVGVATDPTTGNVVVTGGYNGVVDFGGGGLDTFNNGGIYLAGFDPSGNYLWATATGGGGDAGMGVSIDSSGNLALTGKASYAIYFGGSLSLLGNGQMNVFVAAFTLSGNSAPAYRWAKTVGATSSGASVGNAVALDPLGHILVGGSFTAGVDFGGISATAGAPGYSSGFLTQYSR